MANNLPRLLIVDDIAGNRKTLIASLWQEKVETFEAETGVEALAMLDEVDPDLILLDVMMPELDGFETTRRIRQRDGYQGLPIVLVTALDDNVSLLEGLEAGADDFISKPFNQLELRARVGSILRLNSYRRLEEERAARNAADAQARHTQQVYRAVVEKAQLMVHMTSAQGDILFTNGPWQKQLGYSEEEAANLNLAEIVLEEDLEHCFSIHSRIFATDENAFIEARLKSKSGEVIHVEGAAIRYASEADRSIALLRNVTQEIQLKQELERAQRLEQVGRLTAGLAHDFGNILAVIGMTAAVLPRPDSTSAGEMADEIQEAVEDGMALVSDLMGVSRSAKISPTWVRASDEIPTAFDTIERLLPAGITVQRACECGDGVVFLHPGTLRRILLNLATNARDAMGGRGQIYLECMFLSGDENEPPTCEIRFRDTGPGMPDITLEQAFDPFFTTKAEGQGTGLGLASARGLMEQQDGNIRAERCPDGGMAFALTFQAKFF